MKRSGRWTDRRLIQVAFPLKQASLDSVHESSVHHGHISTLHIWPARRPLAACRAALIATLLPDPGDKEERREIMETCTPVGPALHSGTYNAPPVLVIAIRALLDEVMRPDFYTHLDALGERLYAGMREILMRHGIAAWVQGIGARFGLLFGLDREPRDYRDVAKQDMDMMGRFHLACLKRGVYLHHVSPAHGYPSAHTMADIDQTRTVMDAAPRELVSR